MRARQGNAIAKRGTMLAVVAVALAVLAIGCGGGGETTSAAGGGDTGKSTTVASGNGQTTAVAVKLPTDKAIESCFRKEGVTSVYNKKEHGARVVNGLVQGAGTVSIVVTGSPAKTKKILKTFEKEGLTTLKSLEPFEARALGFYSPRIPASKKALESCISKLGG
ncbi:MAG TPA: hypothetical protein VMS11_01715 [Solirubrobacterales bacterium]|nr:hypothetical protein [Solirubrobacterales bacterium]